MEKYPTIKCDNCFLKKKPTASYLKISFYFLSVKYIMLVIVKIIYYIFIEVIKKQRNKRDSYKAKTDNKNE